MYRKCGHAPLKRFASPALEIRFTVGRSASRGVVTLKSNGTAKATVGSVGQCLGPTAKLIKNSGWQFCTTQLMNILVYYIVLSLGNSRYFLHSVSLPPYCTKFSVLKLVSLVIFIYFFCVKCCALQQLVAGGTS